MEFLKKYLSRVSCISLCILLLATIFISSFTVASQEAVINDGYELIAQTDDLKLFLNKETTSFYVENTADGFCWYSNPVNSENDKIAEGIDKTELKSLISAVCYNTGALGGASMDRLNSYSSSVLDGNYKLKTIKNGFSVEYSLDDGNLIVPMEVYLNNNKLDVKIQTSKMSFKKDISVSSISVLPYFGAGSKDETGYLMVPDGCGGIINFHNGKISSNTFEKQIYGANISDSLTTIDDLKDPTRAALPVFGIKRNNSAVLSVINEGAELAAVKANVDGAVTEYSNVYPEFSLYSNMEYTLSNNATVIFEKKNSNLTDISLSYYFLSGDDSNYSGMARKYRSLLIEEGTLKENNSITYAPYLTVYGGITMKRSYFGLLIDTVVPMTTTEQLCKIVKHLNTLGVKNPVINYKNWNGQELKGSSVTDLKPSSKLVSRGYSFDKLFKNTSFSFFPTVSSLVSYTNEEGLIGKYFNPMSDISGISVYRQAVSKTTLKEYGKRNYYLSFNASKKSMDKFNKSLKKSEYKQLGLSDVGNTLYEDFRKGTKKRNDFREVYEESLLQISDKTKLIMDNPNSYGLAGAAEIINVPVMTDKQFLIDEEIPFSQMVYSGCVRYGTNPLNYEDNKYAVLKTLETGSMPHYFTYFNSESLLKNTDYSDLCGGGYKLCLERFADISKIAKKLFDETKGSQMISHNMISDNVFCSEYSNGTKVYVNYNDFVYSISENLVIDGYGYLIRGASE